MSEYFYIEPEVAGGLGERGQLDRSTHPPEVIRFHYEFDGWFGDQLVTGFPFYLVTEKLADELSKRQFSGFELATGEVTISSQFEEVFPDQKLPIFLWLKITGKAGKDDFGIAPPDDWRLVTSERALAVIKPLCPTLLEVSEYPASA